MLKQLTPVGSPKPFRSLMANKANAINVEFDTDPSDSVAIAKPAPTRPSARQQHRLALFAALALACMPTASGIFQPVAPAPVTHVVPADSWVAGVPGRDVVATRLEGVQFSLQQGHLTSQQAGELRQRLQNLPVGGEELVNRLAQFDNLYDVYRLPGDSPAAPGARSVDAGDPATNALIAQGFQLYDRNHDRAISRSELTRALGNASLGERQGAPAAAMSALYGELSGNLGYITHSSVKEHAGQLSRLTQVTLANQDNQPDRLPLDQESFDSSRLRQHFQGSCVLLSTLLELSPQHLREMIVDNHNGTYTVHFRNGKEATISDLTPAERAFFSNSLEGERWPGLFEKAVGAVRASEGVGGGDLITAGRTIPPAEAIALMTGKTAEFRHIVALGPSGLRQFLVDAQRRHEPIIAGISRTDSSTGLIGHHEYAVKGFNPLTNMVTLRNPHARGVWHGSKLNENGLFEMPLGEFYNHYHNITALRD